MSFISGEYAILLAVVLAVYWRLPHRAQNLLLILASLVFYGWFDPRYIALLLYAGGLDYGSALAMERWPWRKGRFLAMSVFGNFSLLAIFKYFDFFLENVAAGLTALGIPHDVHTLGILLPVGISFYTFSTMSYTTDVYRGRIQACRDPVDYLLFVSFFPQLVAGPICRASQMFPQIVGQRVFDLERLRSGLALCLWGAFKKVVVADTLAGFVNPIFAQDAPSSAMIWSAAAGSVVMMFADFSGYSDIALGSARMLGFDLPRNFNAPFLAVTPNEWWTRWHISFYDWIRDYVFQPLVLNPWCRKNLILPFVKATQTQHVVRGIVGSMMFSGLWHGAAWHYVFWGAFFAVVQLAYHFGGRLFPLPLRQWPHRRHLLRPLMVCIWLVSALLFREGDLSRALGFFLLDPTVGSDAEWFAAATMSLVTAVATVPLVVHWYLTERLSGWWNAHRYRPTFEAVVWTAAAWSVVVFLKGSDSDFEYFRF